MKQVDEDEIIRPDLEEANKRIAACKANRNVKLSLASLHLTELPIALFELDFIEQLELDDNPIKNLSNEIANLKSLRQISLSDFKFSKLPDSFENLKMIEDVALSSKFLSDFPNELLSCDKLTSINLSGCQISRLPYDLVNLHNLKTLWLYNNPIGKIDHLASLLNKLEKLSINATKITKFGFLKELHKIERLAMGGKNVIEFPREICGLETLKKLHITRNKIQIIPFEIKNLINLEELTIYNSEIESLPETLFSLVKIQNIWISETNLKSLPKSIGNLLNLKTLKLSNNNLREIPAGIGMLKALESLDLADNELNKLPSEIGDLTNLHMIDIAHNNIVSLPHELSNLAKLETLYIYANDNLVSPPKDVISKGTDAILSYLKDLSEEVKVWSSKLVIVGEGQVGKSCLLDSLNDEPFELGKPTTHALNLSHLTFNHPKQDCEMRLNVWDFGGQDIYHATHQFYLSNHSLILIVWSARAGYDSGKIYKWLETTSALAPDSSIFIVATNSADRGADLPKGDILSLYPDKITFFEVDNESREGIDELKEAIREKAVDLKYMGIDRPKSWINSLDEIKITKGEHISKLNLFQIFERNGVSKNSYESLAGYLHDLGEILYYPDEEELNDTIIIKPVWLSVQIAKILDSDLLSENEGFLNKKLMQDLWVDIDSTLHEKLITLMEKFDLSYKTKDDKEISLIVEKLKFEEHKDSAELWTNFEGANQIVFKYQLDTIPAGIPTWFIARTHRFSMKVHWRYGVLLKDAESKHMALLTVSPERKEIWLKVKGAMPYYFFAQLRDTLELTFNRFEGLKRPAYVPCLGHNGAKCNHLFDLKLLEKRISINPPRLDVECPEALENVEVMELLFGLSFAPNNDILVDRIGTEVEKIIRSENRTQTDELIKFTQLEFIKSYQRAQEIADITCPNTFTLKQIKSNFNGVKLNNHFKLQLFCQMPGCNHSIGDPYNISIPKDWLIAIAPYYNKMLKILKYTLPAIIPGVNPDLSEIANDVSQSFIDSVELEGGVKYGNDSQNFNELSNITETNIRFIRNILDSVDSEQNWAGLRRLVSPEGHILWLCEEHYSEYKV